MRTELPKAYEPADEEPAILEEELKSGYYTPENLPGERVEPFTIVLPPPNATGTLHMGHAVMLAVEDIMIRFQRMRGKKTLWLPGTDHAAIATQVKVEKLLKKEEGLSRHDLGREAFLARVDAFVEDSRSTIKRQVREMGSSVDWSREAFTLDEPRNLAVRTMFQKMYEDGLIYRGQRVINWDPKGQTVISDDELVPVERTAKLYTFRYSQDVPISIATTRPETKVGDTAIAVHPADERYQAYIGQTFTVPFAGATLTLRVIADHEIDPTFGTGALGVTPAHSAIDEAMAQRNDLPMIQVIDEQAHMTEAAGSLVAGLPVLEARERVVQWLRDEGLMEQEEDIQQNVSTAERTGEIVEPLPKLQWFVNVNKPFRFRAAATHAIEGLEDGQEVTLKQVMRHVVETHQTRIIPEAFEKTYFHWIDNLRDWCISRQLWYGHRIPAWYRNEEVFVGTDAPEGEGWVQDEDTLDTWFSSGTWTFSTLGWPAQTSDLETYHPTTVLETGRDILPFWVARMILMTTYALGQVPFRYAYLHGLVRDDQGRKMSKSLDNIIDPLDVKAKYGTDATRLSLAVGLTPGNDTNLSEEKIAGLRNFANKLWNIARFVLTSVTDVRLVTEVPVARTEADRWILERVHQAIGQVTQMLDEPQFQFSQAAEVLRELTWGDFADWYIEVAKVQLQDEAARKSTEEVLLYVLVALLKLWHPFMPLVTTRLWKEFETGELLLIQPWPVASEGASGALFSRVKELVTVIRGLRATNHVPPAKYVAVTLVGDDAAVLEPLRDVLTTLGRVETLTLATAGEKPDGSVSAIAGGLTMYLSLEGMVDVAAERARLQKELAHVEGYLAQLDAKLANAEFLERAPEAAIEKERQKQADARQKTDALREQLAALV